MLNRSLARKVKCLHALANDYKLLELPSVPFRKKYERSSIRANNGADPVGIAEQIRQQLLIRRSLVRAQLGEPEATSLGAMRGFFTFKRCIGFV